MNKPTDTRSYVLPSWTRRPLPSTYASQPTHQPLLALTRPRNPQEWANAYQTTVRTTFACDKTCPSHTSGIKPGHFQSHNSSCTAPLQRPHKPQSIRITVPRRTPASPPYVTMYVSRRLANAEQSVGWWCASLMHLTRNIHPFLPSKPSKRICGRGACLMRALPGRESSYSQPWLCFTSCTYLYLYVQCGGWALFSCMTHLCANSFLRSAECSRWELWCRIAYW
jgi:hypothetical protein